MQYVAHLETICASNPESSFFKFFSFFLLLLIRKKISSEKFGRVQAPLPPRTPTALVLVYNKRLHKTLRNLF